MGRKRKGGVMLPKHVHAVRRASGRVSYYWQVSRNTPKAGPRVRLPDDAQSAEFWQKIAELERGPQRPSGIAAMIEAYQTSPKYLALAPNTRREYDRHMKNLKAAIGQFEPDAVRPADIAGMRDAMGGTPAKANAYVKSISALYKFGRERGFATHNPAMGIEKLAIGEYPPWPMWAWKIAMERFREEIKIACWLGRYTGQRLGDCLKMKLTDLVTDADATEGLDVVQQKTKKQLFVPIFAELRPVIAEARKRGRIFIVSRPDGRPFSVDQFHAMWGREMERDEELAKIRAAGLSFHGLRKEFVVDGSHRDLTPHQIGSLTGQTIQTVQHYSRGASQKRLAKEAAKKLEGGTG